MYVIKNGEWYLLKWLKALYNELQGFIHNKIAVQCTASMLTEVHTNNIHVCIDSTTHYVIIQL